MRNTYIDNWKAVKDRFEQWWNQEPLKKPLMRIIAPGRQGTTVSMKKPQTPREFFTDPAYVMNDYRNYCETHFFLADAFPKLRRVSFGAGTMAVYLGSEPDFSWDTAWFNPIFTDPEQFRTIHYDENNPWWLLHQKMMKEAVRLSKGDFFIPILDIVENVDILASLRGPQNLCFDMIDEPELVKEGVKIIDDLYFKYYDRCYEILKDEDNSSAYQGSYILGYGRVAQLQCDHSAMISEQMYRDFVQPSLVKQCRNLDHAMYHLDGPDAVKHLPALMEIKELDAVQWIPGAGRPEAGSEAWQTVHEQVRGAGKSLQIHINGGGPSDWAAVIQRLVKRYGATGFYFMLPDFPDLASAKKMDAMFD